MTGVTHVSYFSSYTTNNPPRRGKPLKIWTTLTNAGFEVLELHYNPNCWMRGLENENGWATWACALRNQGRYEEYWCGFNEHGVYLQLMAAPYTAILVRKKEEKTTEVDE